MIPGHPIKGVVDRDILARKPLWEIRRLARSEGRTDHLGVGSIHRAAVELMEVLDRELVEFRGRHCPVPLTGHIVKSIEPVLPLYVGFEGVRVVAKVPDPCRMLPVEDVVKLRLRGFLAAAIRVDPVVLLGEWVRRVQRDNRDRVGPEILPRRKKMSFVLLYRTAERCADAGRVKWRIGPCERVLCVEGCVATVIGEESPYAIGS